MARDPQVGHKVRATVTGIKGSCNAGHTVGEVLEVSCHNPAGLCGFFYHSIFPELTAFQFGGTLPWWTGDTIEVACPDPRNAVTLKLARTRRM